MSRKLDVALASALGYGLSVVRESGLIHYDYIGRDGKNYAVPRYSTDGNAMLELDAEMRARGWSLEIDRSLSTIATYSRHHRWVGGFTDAVSAALDTPKAVALAAYYALTGKRWPE